MRVRVVVQAATMILAVVGSVKAETILWGQELRHAGYLQVIL
jgi:hypothetical protein